MIVLFIFLSSCKITQELRKDEYLVNKVRVVGLVENDLREGSKLLIKQKPNKRLFGFWRFYLRAYNYGMRGDTSRRIRKYVRENIGEPPVILDSNALEESRRQITAYLFNNGYFNADVKYTVTPKNKRSKKASITFTVDKKEPYRIREIEYGIDDRKIYYAIISDTKNSKLKEEDIFSKEKMAEERDRLTRKLRNEGYYFFNKEFITFVVDSSVADNYVNVSLQIRNPDFFKTHTRYRINEIYVNVVNPIGEDSLVNFPQWHKTDSVWVNLNGYKIHEDVILRAILMEPGDIFKQEDVDNSYAKLNDIQLFRQSGINFEKDTTEGYLNCYINLFPGKRQEFIIEPQVISSDQNNAVEQNNLRNYGVANVITYRNKNVFRNAEVFEARYRFSLEGQLKKNDSLPFFSNIEHNISTKLYLPGAKMLPILKRILNSKTDRSSFEGNYIYESNIDFKRNVLSVSYNQLYNNIFNSFNVSFAEISYNRTDAKRNFLALVNPADSIFISNLFTTNLILNSRFTWVYSDKPITRNGSYFFSKLIVESAGYTLKRFMGATNQPLPADGIYKIDNVNFEQFVKLDGDVRYTQVLNELNTMAYRIHTGIGIPYGNSKIMPFVRRYFIGGANSLRGWRPRTLGPGSFNNTLSGVRADRSGEIILETQAEYRFSIIRNLLQGATFVDAGNIWYTHKLEGREGVEISWDFVGQMAVSSGLGLRFDFSFFILRFDFGIPLRSPDLPVNERWLFNDYASGAKKVFPAIILNLGLNYPF